MSEVEPGQAATEADAATDRPYVAMTERELAVACGRDPNKWATAFFEAANLVGGHVTHATARDFAGVLLSAAGHIPSAEDVNRRVAELSAAYEHHRAGFEKQIADLEVALTGAENDRDAAQNELASKNDLLREAQALAAEQKDIIAALRQRIDELTAAKTASLVAEGE